MTMLQDLEAAKEALNSLAAWRDGDVGPHMDEPHAAWVARELLPRLTALIEQVKGQEPQAWLVLDEEGSPSMVFLGELDALCYCDDDELPTPLYAAPQPAAPAVDVEGLPDLPDPKWIYHPPADEDEPGSDELFLFATHGAVDAECPHCERLYTASQMDAYARAALRMHLEKK